MYISSQLAQIATLFTGLTIRNRTEISETGAVRLIQPRSIVAGPRIDLSNTDTIEARAQLGRQLLADGDLVLRTRGSRFEAASFVSDDGISTVASAPLIILRPDQEKVRPDYLQWLLNESPEVRRALGNSMRGSTVQALNIEDLVKIEVPVPVLDRQRLIVDASRLARRAAEIEQRLSDLRRTHTVAVLSDAARRTKKEQ